MLSSPTYIDHGHTGSPVYYASGPQTIQPVGSLIDSIRVGFIFVIGLFFCLSLMNWGLNARMHVLLNRERD